MADTGFRSRRGQIPCHKVYEDDNVLRSSISIR